MARELTAPHGSDAGPSAGLLRVTPAPGTGRDDTPTVFEIDPDGSIVHEWARGRASLAVDEPPHARLTTSPASGTANDAPRHAGTHAVLVTPLPDARRAAAGIRRVEVVVDGWRFELDVESDARARLRERATSARAESGKGGPSELRAIIPGRVVSVDVAEGDPVEAGGRLLVLEAMKMQNEVRAPRAGTVAKLAVGPGQTVELGDVLLVIE
jgi:biotin carboxyl carrier protein